jgi:two-component system, sensor histidine kinase YesM
MIDEIKILLEQHYNAGLKIKNAEYKLLQAQINPHFLYNTLELVNWMAINRDVFDISELIQKLTRYYRLSLSKGAEVITIKDEVEHALTYLDIQNKRFDNCAKIIVNINERILECKVIKVILQPIVENAFYHGILEKYNEKGTISIRGILHDGIISIFVEDDGVGMSKEKVNSILSFKKNDTESGYGVLNTHNRLKLQYGNQYGLNYTSIEGKKTIVEIRIPEIR